MKPIYKKPFVQFVKKAHKPLQLAIEDEVEVVCADPGVGEAKVGDLAGIRVHKFRLNRQEYLIAYRLPPTAYRDPGSRQQAWILKYCGSTFTRWARTRTPTTSSSST
ncbi:ParE-like toxin of type II bacterial toxin-antitoxin system [compost metagenome]